MIDQLKDLKDTYENARSQIDRGKEPLEELITLHNFLTVISENPSFIEEKMDKDYKRFFYDDFTQGLLKRLTKERSKNDKYLDIIAGVEECFIKIFVEELRKGHFNQQFFDSIKMLFEYDTVLHNYNYQIPEDELKRLRNTNQEWRKELKIGDMIDAIVDENNRCSGWSQAKISQVNGDLLFLEFIYDTKNADRYIDRWSVEIAQFETKTKELFEWKSTLSINAVVDAHDKTVWNKSTILDIKEQQVTPDRVAKMAFIAYRIYVENGAKSDERGTYDGWSNRFDEWVSVYSPRIQPFYSKTQKGTSDDIDLDEELDSQIKPEEGRDKVYAVPRLRKCTSSLFINLINLFGHLKGYDLILECLDRSDGSEEQFDLNTLAILMQIISIPFLIYHKEFIVEYGPKFVSVCKRRLREAPEKSLRDVRREKIDAIIKSVDNIQRRLILKEEREKETEVLRLEVSMMCLKSNYLERRIQGIRDLNQIIKNNRMMSIKSFTPHFLIEWMQSNEVFNILFDTKKTHLQLVQRCTDILKLLLQEDMFTPQLMEMFWSLAKSDYKFEVYKIINDCSFYFKQAQIDFFFEQIRIVPPHKLAMEEFQCLSELGKYAKDEDFKIKVSDFFWKVICNSDSCKEELVNSCITKFCEMVRSWDLQKKNTFFVQLTQNLAENKSSISSLRLFKGLLKDQKERYTYNSSPQKGYYNAAKQEDITEIKTELTLNAVIDNLIKENQLVSTVLNNLKHYCEQANSKIVTIPTETRKKLFLVNNKYSHHDEIDERLQFIKYIAQISDYTISKVELGVIYDLLVIQSKLPSDQEEFLNWCKSSCEQSSALTTILDLNEVGEFFTQKMQSKELDVKNLLSVGFEFLQQYFLTANEKESKVFKSQKAQKPQKFTNMGYNYNTGSYGFTYGPQPLNKGYYKSGNQQQVEEEDDRAPVFKLLVQPSQLNQLDIVWNIALNCENPKVVPKAIDFLIKVYTCLDDELVEKRIEIQDELIDRCMNLIRTTNDEFITKRVIEILKNIIYEAEKKGTGDVKPHNALLKGELLNKVVVKNKASPKRGNIVMSIYSNATIWEFKKEVAKQLELAPKYLKIERNDGKVIKDIENGKTLAELGFQNNEAFTAYKVNIEEEVVNVPLTGPDGKLTDKTRQIFNEWFDMYSDESGSMTRETCAQFIKGCTGEFPSLNDERITNLFKNFDINNDGKIERQEFMGFYETAARNKPETVRENLRAHNIRNDLKKLSEIQEETSFKNTDMPRYKLSKNQEQFEILLSLLDRNDTSSQASWDLIQMLSTNETLYKRVLQLKNVEDPITHKIDWSKFFDSNSLYKLLYTLQIIEAVMEEGEGEGLEKVDIIVEDSPAKKNIPKPPPLQGAIQVIPAVEEEQQQEQPKEEQAAPKQQQVLKRHSSVVDNNEDDNLKQEWTSMFLKNNGFQYILKVFMDKEIRSSESTSTFNQAFELKHIAFLLKLLRIFIMAAFSTSSESQVYAVASLVRKSSSYQEDEQISLQQQESTEGSRFKDLQVILHGPLGSEIIESIDYRLLQSKILKIIAQILVKEKMIFEDKLIIENALSLWVGCILHKNQLFNEFYSFKGDEGSKVQTCDDFVLNGLLFCSQEKVREEFKQSFSSLSHKLISGGEVKQTPLFYLLKLLSQNFALISNYHCKQYFELFCELIDQYFMARNIIGEGQGEAFNPEQLLSLIIDKIKEYNKLATEVGTEEAVSDGDNAEEALEQLHNEQENIYIGLIQLTGKIIDNFDISFSEKIVESKNLIDEIFIQFLFASVFKQQGSNQLDNLRIKPKKSQRKQGKKVSFGKKSKDAAYKLLNSLIRKSPVLMNAFLEKSMVPLMKLIKRHEGWNYTPPGNSERSQKYVGLKNLGCICYMNAMMQQFFMIPAFRYNLLCVEDKMPQDLQEYKGQQIDDNVLHQLQKLMAHLELSERQDYNPFEFCFAFKDLDGAPTNTSEQKDAQEFLNLAFDRIENMLRDTSRKYLLQSVFGGKTCSQLICTECGKVKNRIEDYYNLSLTVKDIKSMHDSLQKLIEGEVINDYECDGCKKKVDISKRTLISSTPNVLIVHLQRIIFNFDTFRNDKINSYFEFPYQLDLKPYSFYDVMNKENRLKKKKEGEEEEEPEEIKKEENQDEDNQWPEEDNCFEYKLVGVVVHSGTANAGHYWSYINTKRGFQEPNEDDPNWSKTENDPWMEFNDSTVREFNFEKLKEEGYGGDGKGGSDDAWSFGGSYGKSAYMLVYERKQKRDLKILVNQDDVDKEKEKGEHIEFDDNKKEHYKLIDYREGVEDIAPNQIYKQVFEDNQKFEFENDIYSSEFFEFINGILKAVVLLDKDRKHSQQIMEQVKQNVLSVGKKAILEILTKCFYNQSIKELVASLIDIFKKDPQVCVEFMKQCLDQDDGNYLIELLLDCPDVVSRSNVANLLKYVVNTLKISEKDHLYETEKIEVTNDKGEKSTVERPKALSARFILKCFSVLNTIAAKNWSRFDNFLELLYSFAFGDREVSGKAEETELDKEINEEQKVGIEFFFRNRFVEKACDFLLGRKSPLCEPSQKRIEMGGSFTQPNFNPIIKLITNMITQEELIEKYKLSDLEKKMLLHNDLLKVMLGSSQGSKQFGQCLANMCKDNVKLSKKVSKVFIKSINSSNFDNVKNYLTALKPFIKLNDSIKPQKLEWVFGFNQIIAKKGYREEKFKYGLEFVDKINEEANTYICPLLNGPVEDALLSQLLKCKGKLDTFAINCLKEMLSLMAKDDDIARFVYFSAPPTYQHARYSDWIKPYLEHQKADIERSNAYSYFKNKHDTILKTLSLIEVYEEKCKKFAEEEKEQAEQYKDNEQSAAMTEDWLAYQSEEVIPHFPSQLIIGKQVGEDREFLVYDEDPLVRVNVFEVTCEYNYSNPTGWFNLSLPHIDLRTNNYQTISYAQYKKIQVDNEKNKPQSEEDGDNETTTSSENPQEETKSQETEQQPVQEVPIVVRNWFETKKEAPLLLKVYVTNKQKSKVSVKVTLESSNGNIICPKSFVKDIFIDNDSKCILHLQKVDPSKEWGTLIVKVDSHETNPIPNPPSISTGKFNKQSNSICIGTLGRVSPSVQCPKCHKPNDADQQFCEACGDSLDSYMEQYFQA